MSHILLIDTSVETGMVGLSKDNIVLQVLYSGAAKEHASFLQPAIQRLLTETGTALSTIDAVAVTAGPGSYTGLRVGMASAKGLCYALGIPLITLNTLETMAASAVFTYQGDPKYSNSYFCPMIDARRMEVFTAVYSSEMEMMIPCGNMVLTETSFDDQLNAKNLVFFGTGAKKWQEICIHPNAVFQQLSLRPEAMAELANRQFEQKNYASLAHSGPVYLKDVYINSEKYKKN